MPGSFLSHEHVPDGHHVWVVRPQGSLLDVQRPLKQRPALLLAPLQCTALSRLCSSSSAVLAQLVFACLARGCALHQ